MIEKKWLEDYKTKAYSCLELYTENATIKNLAKIILTLIKEIESSPVEPGVSHATCGNCKHYKPSEYLSELGDCKHPKFSENIILYNCDDMYVSQDFGCINFESKLSG